MQKHAARQTTVHVWTELPGGQYSYQNTGYSTDGLHEKHFYKSPDVYEGASFFFRCESDYRDWVEIIRAADVHRIDPGSLELAKFIRQKMNPR